MNDKITHSPISSLNLKPYFFKTYELKNEFIVLQHSFISDQPFKDLNRHTGKKHKFAIGDFDWSNIK